MGSQSSSHLTPSLRSLRRSAGALYLLAILSLVGGLIAAFVIATAEDDTGSLGRDAGHPYVAVGVAVGFGGLIVAAVLAFAANWAYAWIEAHETQKPR